MGLRGDVVSLAAALDCRSADDVAARLGDLFGRADAIATEARVLEIALRVLPDAELQYLALQARVATESVCMAIGVTRRAVESQL